MRLAGTVGRCFEPGILIKKIHGHHDIDMTGFLIEAEQNPAGHILGTVLTEKRISNWLLSQTEIVQDLKRENNKLKQKLEEND